MYLQDTILMKDITDLFHPLRDLHLSPEDKMQIRQRVLQKRTRTLFLRRFWYYAKLTTFVGVSAFALALFLSAFQPQESERNIASLTDAFITFTSNHHAQVAQAETIGRLLEIYGVAHVLDKDGNMISKTELFAGEMVVLQPGAKVVVQVRDHTFAQIIWPAKFTLEAVPNGAMTYILNILEGTYVEVAMQQPDTETTATQGAVDTVSKKPEHIVIKTKQVEIVTDTEADSHFAITQSDKTAEVVASEGKVLVKNITQAKEEEVALIAGETAMVAGETVAIHLPASHEEVTQLAKTSEDLLIRYARSDTAASTTTLVAAPETWTDTTIPLFDDQIEALSPRLDSGSMSKIQEQLGTTHSRIIAHDDLLALEQALNPQITQYNIDQMMVRKAKGNTSAFVIAYGNLLDELHSSYQILGQPQPSVTPGLDSLQAGIIVANQLMSVLETAYTLPPSLKQDIQLIVSGIVQVQALPTGAYPDIQNIQELHAKLLAEQPTTPSTETGSQIVN